MARWSWRYASRVSETCTCTGRSKGFHQHPEFLEKEGDGTADNPRRYIFEFFVCGECNRPTAQYLEKMMERVE